MPSWIGKELDRILGRDITAQRIERAILGAIALWIAIGVAALTYVMVNLVR